MANSSQTPSYSHGKRIRVQAVVVTKTLVERLLAERSVRIKYKHEENVKSAVWNNFKRIYLDGEKTRFVVCLKNYCVVTADRKSGNNGITKHRCLSANDMLDMASVASIQIEADLQEAAADVKPDTFEEVMEYYYSPEEMRLGNLVVEGKTKKVYDLPDNAGQVYVLSKDRITAGDGVKAHDLQGKAVISTDTACKVFHYLNNAGLRTHFVRRQADNAFVARKCDMVPIEWVARRIATGSFLKRHQGVPEGYRFAPLKLETFFKDDANHDPQWSEEQLVSAKMRIGNVTIGQREVDIMTKTTATVFEILERAWSTLDCALVDMKVEYGVDTETGELVLADLIDSDSWRLWPSGDKRLMKDKQVYRNLQEVTVEDLEKVKTNFAWVAEKVGEFTSESNARVAILMGGASDLIHGQKVQKEVQSLGIRCDLRITSAHKGTDQTLKIASHYEGDGIPTVFVAIAGRSNGLGPVLSGKTTYPVINCPPVTPDWGAQDVWSSLRMPSGLGCSTVLTPEAAALHAAQIFALSNHLVWSRLRARQLNTWVGLIREDATLNPDL